MGEEGGAGRKTYACLILAVAFNTALIVAYNICQVASGRHHVVECSWAVCIHGALSNSYKNGTQAVESASVFETSSGSHKTTEIESWANRKHTHTEIGLLCRRT